MQAVIDATGGGSTMAPLNDRQSQYTLPIVSETLIERIVGKLSDIGVERIALQIASESVKSALGAERGVDTVKRGDVEVHFVKNYQSMTSGLDTDEGFLYVKGNTLYDWETLAELAKEEAAIGYVGDPDESAHGQVGIASNGDAIDFHPGDHPMSGPEAAFAYKFPKRAHEWDYGIDPMCVELAHNESPTAVQLSGWEPIEYPHDLLEANRRVVREEHDGTYVAEDATIAPGSVVAGPAVLLEGTHVMENATVEGSVLLADSYVGPNSYVGHSILGEGTTVEQGVTTVTRDSGDSTVKLRFSDGSKADTESDVFGSVSGPKAKVRGGATLREGSVVGSGTVVQSGQTL